MMALKSKTNTTKTLTFLLGSTLILTSSIFIMKNNDTYKQQNVFQGMNEELKNLSYQDLILLMKKELLSFNYHKALQTLVYTKDNYSQNVEYEDIPNTISRIYVYLMLRMNTEAVRECEGLMKRSPSPYVSLIALSVYIRNSEIEKAMTLLEQLSSMPSEQFDNVFLSSYCRVLICLFEGKSDEALFEYDKLIDQQQYTPFQTDETKSQLLSALSEIIGFFRVDPRGYTLAIADELPLPPIQTGIDPLKIFFKIEVNFELISNNNGKIVYAGNIGL